MPVCLAGVPEAEGLAAGAAGVLVEHAAAVAVVGNEGSRVATQRLFLQNGPIRQVFPGGAVSSAPTGSPLLAIIRDPSGSAVEDVSHPFLLPRLPLVGTPALALEGGGDQLFGISAVAPSAQVKATQRGGDRPSRSWQAVIQPQHQIVHG